MLRLILDTPWMWELSVAEQRYQAVLAVISDGLSISQVAEKVGVSAARLVGPLSGVWPRGLGGWVASPGVMSASDARGGGSRVVGVAPVAAVFGTAAVGVRAGQTCVYAVDGRDRRLRAWWIRSPRRPG